ncbi:MAG: hypothetical protein ISS35_09105 [Kiritimatiellae bacterium]|nr:hypothetical protein [Kiritimatiellia bacterium]
MIDLPIVGTHLHLWDSGHFPYPCLVDVEKLNSPYLSDDDCAVTDVSYFTTMPRCFID